MSLWSKNTTSETHTQRQNEVRGSRKLSRQTNIKKPKKHKTQHKISQNPTQNPIVVFEATTSKWNWKLKQSLQKKHSNKSKTEHNHEWNKEI
jgi:hypothetical protein